MPTYFEIPHIDEALFAGNAILWPGEVIEEELKVPGAYTQSNDLTLEKLLAGPHASKCVIATAETPYTFLSHRHSSDPNVSRAHHVDEYIAAYKPGLVWLDIACIPQGGPKYSKYDYFSHTRPTVMNLHLILRGAKDVLVCLKPEHELESRLTRHIRHELLAGVLYNLRQHCYGIGAPFYALDARAVALSQEMTNNEYYDRLFCYVERIACPKEGPTNLRDQFGQWLKKLRALGNDVIAMEKQFKDKVRGGLTREKNTEERIDSVIAIAEGLFGGGRGAKDPLSFVEQLSCACDADRIAVRRIEKELLGFRFVPEDVVAIQVALNTPRRTHVTDLASIGKFRSVTVWSEFPDLNEYELCRNGKNLALVLGGALREGRPVWVSSKDTGIVQVVVMGMDLGMTEHTIIHLWDDGTKASIERYQGVFYTSSCCVSMNGGITIQPLRMLENVNDSNKLMAVADQFTCPVR
eukprot:Opistho-2@13889